MNRRKFIEQEISKCVGGIEWGKVNPGMEERFERLCRIQSRMISSKLLLAMGLRPKDVRAYFKHSRSQEGKLRIRR